VEVGASETTKANYLRLDRKEVHVWDDHGYSRRQVNAENDACGWMKVGKVEGQVDPSHDAEAG
jgi:hypothetical protein